MNTPRLTPRQAAIVGAFTGKLAGPFGDMHKYIEEIMGRPVFTHELGDAETANKIAELAKPDFLAICATEGGDA